MCPNVLLMLLYGNRTANAVTEWIVIVFFCLYYSLLCRIPFIFYGFCFASLNTSSSFPCKPKTFSLFISICLFTAFLSPIVVIVSGMLLPLHIVQHGADTDLPAASWYSLSSLSHPADTKIHTEQIHFYILCCMIVWNRTNCNINTEVIFFACSHETEVQQNMEETDFDLPKKGQGSFQRATRQWWMHADGGRQWKIRGWELFSRWHILMMPAAAWGMNQKRHGAQSDVNLSGQEDQKPHYTATSCVCDTRTRTTCIQLHCCWGLTRATRQKEKKRKDNTNMVIYGFTAKHTNNLIRVFKKKSNAGCCGVLRCQLFHANDDSA